MIISALETGQFFSVAVYGSGHSTVINVRLRKSLMCLIIQGAEGSQTCAHSVIDFEISVEVA